MGVWLLTREAYQLKIFAPAAGLLGGSAPQTPLDPSTHRTKGVLRRDLGEVDLLRRRAKVGGRPS